VLASALPNRTSVEREAALIAHARDVGVLGADNDTGSGLLDIKAAYDALVAVPPPPPTPLPPLEPALALFSTARIDASGSGSTLIAVTNSGLRVFFDGADVGLGDTDVVAAERAQDGALLLAVDRPVTVPGAGLVTAYDVVRFRPATLGDQTAGSFEMVLRGNAVGLSTATEKIDALALSPDGRLLVSTNGPAIVRSVTAGGEDLLAFSPATARNATTGSWTLHFDGSAVGVSGSPENVDAALVLHSGAIVLSTTGRFTAHGASGGGADILTCRARGGSSRNCTRFKIPSDAIAAALDGRAIDAVSLP
jgi:hypothetical protein